MTSKSAQLVTSLPIDSLILELRGERVILDTDLARIYGVATFRFNEAVKRNQRRFPADFRFQLSGSEWAALQALRSQNAILENAGSTAGRGRHRKYVPWVFTEHGAIMAANVLNSEQAVDMSVFVVRAFVKLRQTMATHKELDRKSTRLNSSHSRASRMPSSA